MPSLNKLKKLRRIIFDLRRLYQMRVWGMESTRRGIFPERSLRQDLSGRGHAGAETYLAFGVAILATTPLGGRPSRTASGNAASSGPEAVSCRASRSAMGPPWQQAASWPGTCRRAALWQAIRQSSSSAISKSRLTAALSGADVRPDCPCRLRDSRPHRLTVTFRFVEGRVPRASYLRELFLRRQGPATGAPRT